jgi:hypothetical protein
MSKKQELEGVSVKLSKEKSEVFFHSALCNGLGELASYGLQLDFNPDDYKKASKNLRERMEKGEFPPEASDYDRTSKKITICYEDVLMELLRSGKSMKIIDSEGAYTRRLTIKMVHDRVQNTPISHLIEYINDTGGDAITADVILQTVLFGKIIFG